MSPIIINNNFPNIIQHEQKTSSQYLIMKNERKKTKLNKTQLGKKALLLKQKFLTNASITHNNYQYRIDALKEEHEETRKQLNQQINQLGSALQQTAQKFKKDMEMMGNIGQNKQIRNSITSQLIQSQQLKNYLNAQKSALKQMLQNESKSIQPGESEKLHNLIRKKNLQQALEYVKLKQLQRQVKYLSTNVINSSGIIYIPQDNITEAQQNQLNSQLQIQLTELDRLINLQVICSENQSTNNQTSNQYYLEILNNQEKRLATVFQLLTAEKQSISTIENSIDRFLDLSKSFPLFSPQQLQSKSHLLGRKRQETVTEQQIQAVLSTLNLSQQTETISNRTCSHEQLNNSLKALRTKIKKLE